MVGLALRREMIGAEQAEEPYRHRIPLGLLMLSRRWITREQLTAALLCQKSAGQGKLGEWLIRTQGVDEQLVANALAGQWGAPFLGAPVLPLEAPPDLGTARLLPRLFVQVFDAVPLQVAASKILYLAVNQRVDRLLNAALESMTGLTVEAGVMKPSAFNRLRDAALADAGQAARLFSCSSIESLETSITDLISPHLSADLTIKDRVVWSRLVRVKGYLWLRVETVGCNQPQGAETRLRDAIFTLPHAP